MSMMELQVTEQAAMLVEGFELGAEAMGEQEDVLDWLKPIGIGAAAGASTGAAAGPYGALIGGATGAVLGAVQAAQGQGKPAPSLQAPPRPAPAPVSPAGVAAGQPSASPAPPAPSPASAASGQLPTTPAAAPSAGPTTTELLQQLAQLLPQLMQLLAQPAPARRAGESLPESEDGVEPGSYILDKIPYSESGAEVIRVTAESSRVDQEAGWSGDSQLGWSLAEAVIDYPTEWSPMASDEGVMSFGWTR
jgi:hypothetical protein